MTPRPDPSARRLADVVARFGRRRVAVLADLVADEFIHGDIVRVSREAPVLILEHRRTVVTPGGGGNAVANLAALGADPIPIGIVGRDEAGRLLLRQLRQMGVRTSGIRVQPGYETPTKSRILAGGVHTRRQQVVRLDRGARRGGRLPREALSWLGERLGRALRRSEGLLVSDYGYGAATPELLRRARARSVPEDFPVVVDSRGRVAHYRQVTACTPNQEELEGALALEPLGTERSLEEAGRELLRLSGNRAVLATRGAKGMCLLERGQPPYAIPAHGTGEVADVTGAGDTVIAAFVLSLLAGATFRDAAHLANRAAGIVVTKAGTATLSRQELLASLGREEGP